MQDPVLTLSFVMFYSAGGVIVAGNGGRTICNNTPEARLAILEEDVSSDFSYFYLLFVGINVCRSLLTYRCLLICS